ncbi:MAG: hypothetical protein RL885_06120 [Planctomycetota bacterium]
MPPLLRPLLLPLAAALLAISALAQTPFRITVLDRATGRGVPLVKLTTTNGIELITDSAGVVAFDEPGLLGRRVFFHVESPGYTFPADGFGIRGKALDTQAGGSAQLVVDRVDIAERLYRITGSGIYRDSVLLGDTVPLSDPIHAGGVMGQDTVIVTEYQGRLYWFWGDTNRAAYPLGNFLASGATSKLPGQGGLEPDVGIDLTYFVDQNGFSKEMCPFGRGHLVWIEWVVALPDTSGQERLIARYSVVESLGVASAWGIAQFNDQSEIFEPLIQFAEDAGHRSGHPFRAEQDGQDWLYLHSVQRVPPTIASVKDPSSYQAFTPLVPGARSNEDPLRLERDGEGNLVWGWKAGTDPLFPGHLIQLIGKGRIAPDEAPTLIRDIATGEPTWADRGSIAWNPYRKRWVRIAGAFGSIWLAEADTPVGPWAYGRRVVHFENYTFYNPAHHPFFDRQGGRRIFFEGTYTKTFSNAPVATPRYDYNQILYALDLGDSRLDLPVPVYHVLAGPRTMLQTAETLGSIAPGAVPFYALPPGASSTGPITVRESRAGGLPREDRNRIVFRALPPEPGPGEEGFADEVLVPLYEYQDPATGRRLATVETDESVAGWSRGAQPIGRVWKNPNRMMTRDPVTPK